MALVESNKRKRVEDGSAEEKDPLDKYRKSDIVELDVGGTKFKTRKSTLKCYPNTMLGMVFSREEETKVEYQPDGSFFIDREPTLFPYIINFYRTGVLANPYQINGLDKIWSQEKTYYGVSRVREFKAKIKNVPKEIADRIEETFRNVMEEFIASSEYKLMLQFGRTTATWHFLQNEKTTVKGKEMFLFKIFSSHDADFKGFMRENYGVTVISGDIRKGVFNWDKWPHKKSGKEKLKSAVYYSIYMTFRPIEQEEEEEEPDDGGESSDADYA